MIANFYMMHVSNTCVLHIHLNPLSANPTKWSNTQTICWLLPTNYLSVFDHFVGLALKRLMGPTKFSLLKRMLCDITHRDIFRTQLAFTMEHFCEKVNIL